MQLKRDKISFCKTAEFSDVKGAVRNWDFTGLFRALTELYQKVHFGSRPAKESSNVRTFRNASFDPIFNTILRGSNIGPIATSNLHDTGNDGKIRCIY